MCEQLFVTSVVVLEDPQGPIYKSLFLDHKSLSLDHLAPYGLRELWVFLLE